MQKNIKAEAVRAWLYASIWWYEYAFIAEITSDPTKQLPENLI